MREGRRGREGARKGAAGRGAAAAAGPGGRAPRARGASGCPGPRGGGGQMLGPEQNTRAGGARGGCGGRTGPLASCALGGCPSPQPRPCPLPRRPQLFSRKINRLEGPPADKACVYAASSLVTGVAWQRARRGLRDHISAAALRRHPGSDVGEGERREDLRPPPLSCPPRSLSGGSGGSAVGGALGGRRVGDRGPQGREGEGKEGMPSHGACRARARRHPARTRCAPRPQEWGYSPGDRWTPPQKAAARGCPRCGIRGPSGLWGWIWGRGVGGAVALT